MGGQGGEAYGSPFDIFEQFFGGAGMLCQRVVTILYWSTAVMLWLFVL